MTKHIASAKPGNSVILTTDLETGKKVYFVSNHQIITYENRETGEIRSFTADRIMSKSEDLDIWDLAKRRYRRAIRIFRRIIDKVLSSAYKDIPVYRDSDISSIMLMIRCNRTADNRDLALTINKFIKKNKHGKE